MLFIEISFLFLKTPYKQKNNKTTKQSPKLVEKAREKKQ